jgi:hypothetical protein
MRDAQAFEYRGWRVTIEIRQPQAESDTGVYMTTIAIAAMGPDGAASEPMFLCKRAQYVYLDEDAAFQAAMARARAHIDGLPSR